ncbi:MAG TPA: papain-like cysteine protease family protein [Puia sp.]|nr:papain-like cysteine protease family protein [Puia sp.]
MSVKLDVPTVAQTSNNTCWHASASMVWLYSQSVTGRQGPMNTLANKWGNDQGASPSDFISLAQKAGMKSVWPRPAVYDSNNLEQLLRKYGPLWCAGRWYGPKHIIVLTGVNGNIVYLNDPANGGKKVNVISWFNDKLDNHVDGCIMYKDPMAY